MTAIIGSGAQSRYRLAQEQEFYKYIPQEHALLRYAPFDRASSENFTPQPSPDAALTSFAQLAAIRLGADRALVSLFDASYQHVLVEATPTLSLVGGHVRNDGEQLKLGACVFPKERGICQFAETVPLREHQRNSPDSEATTVVVLDASKDGRLDRSKLHAALSDMLFFVVVPIISPRGLKIGALSIMDSKARLSGPDQHTMQFVKDMAATIMDHLAMRATTVKNRRAERMIVGLGSFVEGRTTLRDSWTEAHAQHMALENSGEMTEGQLNMEQQDLQESADKPNEANGTAKKSLPIREFTRRHSRSHRPPTPSPGSTKDGRKAKVDQNTLQQRAGMEFTHDDKSARAVLTGSALKEDALPPTIRNVFSRAANLLRESIEAEGVVFLDATGHRFGGLVDDTKRRLSGSDFDDQRSRSEYETAGSDSSTQRSVSDQDNEGTEWQNSPSPFSECLGFSSSRISSINDEEGARQAVTVPERLFTSLIRRYPRGKIFVFNADGSVSEESDDRVPKRSGSENDTTSQRAANRSSTKRSRQPAFKRYANELIKIFSGARSILVLPLWDSDRSRWFAGALIWTNDADRIFTPENELVYTSAFSNSIMAEMRRIDMEVAERAKTNLISSITHELRNPLHGILGTADIMSDTAMNALQHGMVHTVESCGRTLLDTINSLLDLTFIDQYRRGDTSQRRKNQGNRRGLPVGNKSKSLATHVELDYVLEEVVDCVFAGYCFYHHPQAPPPALTESASRTAGQTHEAEPVGPQASQVTVIFDIEPNTEWAFDTHAGAWRRILMNIFGNALKYTQKGYIYVGLKSSHCKGNRSTKSPNKDQKDVFNMTITVKDTGKGIGPLFLQSDLFSPFKQEDPMAPGSGLGLSIVRQAVGFLGGSIDIQSTVGEGTQISIHAPLTKSVTKPDDTSSKSFTTLRRSTEGRSIGILGFGETLRSQRDTALYSSLERMCAEWFGLRVAKVSPSGEKQPSCDFYLAVQTELDCEDTEGRDLFGLPGHFDIGDSIPIIVICQSPEEAHHMFVAAKGQSEKLFFEFVSQPCGPRKLARAMMMCIKRQREQQSDEPTRWVEVPESSHLPLDIQASDPPADRMKISKRPTKETMGTGEDGAPGAKEPEQSSADQEWDQQSAIPNSSGEETPNLPERSVLLVDDNNVNLQLLCAFTRKDGYRYKSAKDGAQAVEIYKANPGEFHVVVIDISMPVMDGFEASKEIRRIEKEYRARLSESERQALPPVIIAALTGLDSAGAQKEALGSGINVFLVKPLKRAELQAVLRREV
ncbi:hypothetical protein ATEIFO6365_0014007400 [Aspergillus terreus]|uniref:histidine kinase n=1 Tax=Aspergillus terreus TaxID=33178 RepID=A0A5M3Z400_ASPTE|nr:hypothetical protein ATETN484_0008024100 [Aspergillus terreus]GFF21142.1 hypothetical protein ATEIFO6365_0014007400 [Aspergillus terreus]